MPSGHIFLTGTACGWTFAGKCETGKFPVHNLDAQGTCCGMARRRTKSCPLHSWQRRSSGVAAALALRLRGLARARKDLTLWRSPITTLRLFLLACWDFSLWTSKCIFSYWLTLFVLVSIGFGFWGLSLFPGSHNALLSEVWVDIRLMIWWISLGILSSVGLGSGMHTGLLFLCPHIYFICSSAERCGNLDFDWRHNMWSGQMQPGQYFECGSGSGRGVVNAFLLWWKMTVAPNGVGIVMPPALQSVMMPPALQSVMMSWWMKFTSITSVEGVTFVGVMLRVLPSALLWGFGTAVGEVPPYAAAYIATKTRLSGEENEVEEEVEAALHKEATSMPSKIKRSFTKYMMTFVELFGPFAVFVLSAWPNVLFDLCGIICGHFLMPFWKFFPALWAGKGIFKVLCQAAILVFVFCRRYDQARAHAIRVLFDVPPISSIVKSRFGSASKFETFLFSEMNIVRQGVPLDGGGFLNMHTAFSVLVFCCILYFAVTFVEQIAQHRQQKIDNHSAASLQPAALSEDDEVDDELSTLSVRSFSAGGSGRGETEKEGGSTSSAGEVEAEENEQGTFSRRGKRSASGSMKAADAQQLEIELQLQTPKAKGRRKYASDRPATPQRAFQGEVEELTGSHFVDPSAFGGAVRRSARLRQQRVVKHP